MPKDRTRLWQAVVATVAVVAGFTALATTVAMSVPPVEYLIRLGVQGGELRIEPWFSFTLAAGTTLFVLVAVIVFMMSRSGASEKLRTELSTTRSQLTKAQSELKAVIEARTRRTKQAFEIVKHLHPPRNDGRKVLREVIIVAEIAADGTANVNRIEKVQAQQQTLHYFEHKIFSDNQAPGISYAEDIAFWVKDISEDKSKQAAWLPIEDNDHSKSLAVFPLPPIQPNEKAPREIETNYCWPQMLKRLVVKGEEPWSWTMISGQPIDFVRIQLFVSADLDPIDCRLIGQSVAGADAYPKNIVGQARRPGWVGWSYESRNCPGGHEVILQLERR